MNEHPKTEDGRPFGLDHALDAALHLLDRQVVDLDGLMAGKVDDVELTVREGRLEVTGLLTGPSALLPRLGGRSLSQLWSFTSPTRVHRDVPGWIDLAHVVEVGSDVRVRVEREGLVVPQPPAPTGVVRHRLDEVLGLEVVDADGARLGQVLDLRLRAGREGEGRLVVSHVVVGRDNAGVRLGYDRGAVQGPAVLRWLLARMHRHSRLVSLAEGQVDAVTGRVRVRRPAGPLRGTREVGQDGRHG